MGLRAAGRPWSARHPACPRPSLKRPGPPGGRGSPPGPDLRRRRSELSPSRWKGSNIRGRSASVIPSTVVGHPQPDLTVGRRLAGHVDGSARVSQCVGEQVRQRTLQQSRIRACDRAAVRRPGPGPRRGGRRARPTPHRPGRPPPARARPHRSRAGSCRAGPSPSSSADRCWLRSRRGARRGPPGRAGRPWWRRVSAAARMPASGVRRSCDTAASRAVRVRFPASSSRAAAVCRASSSRSRSTPTWVANAASTRRSAGGREVPCSTSSASREIGTAVSPWGTEVRASATSHAAGPERLAGEVEQRRDVVGPLEDAAVQQRRGSPPRSERGWPGRGAVPRSRRPPRRPRTRRGRRPAPVRSHHWRRSACAAVR